MKLALVQQHATRDKQANIERGIEALRAAAAAGARCVGFSELAFEWFHPQRAAPSDVASLAETVPGPMTDAFCKVAKQLQVVVVLNLFERAGGVCFDTSPVIDADGSLLGCTRMVHITDYPCFHEQGYYAPGDSGAPVYDTAVGRIGVAICYDRHFPEYMRALAVAGADLVMVPQAGAIGEWPEGLFEAEMRVAAFQNGYYTALCNRVGAEECIEFAGESFVCAPDGIVLGQAPAREDHTLIVDIELARAHDCYARRLFLEHRRPELYAEWIRP